MIAAAHYATDDAPPNRVRLGLVITHRDRVAQVVPAIERIRRDVLTRPTANEEDAFAHDVIELQSYLGPPVKGQTVRAIPGCGTEVPIWLLGSSLYSAQLAALLGLPFAFASHFAPDALMQALEVYRAGYRPSAAWPKPHAMVGVNVVCGASDDEATRLFTSIQLRFLGMQRDQRGPLPRPIDPDDLERLWSPSEKAQVRRMTAASAVGTPASMQRQLAAIVERTGADELIVAGDVHDHAARLASYERLATIELRR